MNLWAPPPLPAHAPAEKFDRTLSRAIDKVEPSPSAAAIRMGRRTENSSRSRGEGCREGGFMANGDGLLCLLWMLVLLAGDAKISSVG